MRRLIRTLVVCSALVASAADPARPQTPAPRQVPLFPSVVFRGVATPARYFYLAKASIEFPPGAVLPARAERSTRFFTVTEGTLVLTVGGKTETYTVGKGGMATPGAVASARNEGQTTARVVVSSLVPASGEGAITPATASGGAAPRVIASMRLPVGPLPPVIDVIQGGTRYEPGFATGLHVMNETHAILHLEGTTSYEYVDGFQEAFGPGQGAQMYVGRPGLMANRTAAPSAWLITWLVTPGRPLTSPWQHTSH